MVDCCLTKAEIKEHCKDIKAVFITHRHTDHWSKTGIKELVKQGCDIYIHQKDKRFYNKQLTKEYTDEHITYLKGENFTFKAKGLTYNIRLQMLAHDVTNWCLKIIIKDPFEEYKIFHATDTGNLNGIVAKDFNVYSIETNYDEKKIEILIRENLKRTGFSRYTRTLKTHLSKQQAIHFLNKNKGDKFERFVRLHQSESAL